LNIWRSRIRRPNDNTPSEATTKVPRNATNKTPPHAALNTSKGKGTLGMSSFGPKEQQQFGQSVRLAMSCIEGTLPPSKGNALPLDEPSVRHRLKALSQDITSQHADLIELLVRFDEHEGWKLSGASHCAAWANSEIGISIQLSWEYLRVGRKLRSLKTLQALFRVGKISWSKVRLISRVADKENEQLLCHAALDASVSDVKRICNGYKWTDDENSDAENSQAMQQWESRSLTWNEASNGNTRINLTLPPELALAFLKSIEHSLNNLSDKQDKDKQDKNMQPNGVQENNGQYKMPQRRADAAVFMAETSLQAAGREIATADRYQVIISTEAADLSQNNRATSAAANVLTNLTTNTPMYTPKKRPSIKGVGPIASETARRIACDCGISTITTVNGEPISIGRKSRIWTTAIARAIKERDQHCVWPGCTQSHRLQIHHLKHWADDGETSVINGACLCTHHHTLVHEGGYTLERVDDDKQLLQEQFRQQQHTADLNMFDFEKTLRDDEGSFKKVRMLSPTRYRFRVVPKQSDSTRVESSDCTENRNSRQHESSESPIYDNNAFNGLSFLNTSACNSAL